MFRFIPFITTNNTYKLCLMNSLRFCSSTSSTSSPHHLEVANTNDNPEQSVAPYLSACDVELVPISPETFAIRGVENFSGATIPFIDHFKANNGRFNKSMADPRTNRSFDGWIFPVSCQSSMELWMKSLEEEVKDHPIPKDFKKVVAPNEAVELVRLNDRWFVIRSTEKFPMATSFYAEALKSQINAGFVYHLSESEMKEEDRVVSNKNINKNNNDNNNVKFENKPFPGWLVVPKNRQRAEDWIKSLVVLPKMNGSFQTRSSKFFQKKKQNSEGLTQEEKNQKRIENGRLNGLEDWSPQ